MTLDDEEASSSLSEKERLKGILFAGLMLSEGGEDLDDEAAAPAAPPPACIGHPGGGEFAVDACVEVEVAGVVAEVVGILEALICDSLYL